MSKIQEQNFWEKTKRFLEPVRHHKKVTFLLVLYFVAQFSFGIIFVLFVRDATQALEEKNRELFQNVLYEYGLIFVIAFLLVFTLYKGWIYSFNRYREYIEEKYLPAYISFDMNHYEKVGTGKSIAIISKGVKMWGGLIDRILIESIVLIMSLGISFYLLVQINNTLVVILVFLLVFGLSLGLFLNKKVIKWRKKRIELDNMWSKRVVKIIMAKMEILQSGKIQSEVEKLHENHENQIYYNGKIALYLVPFFVVGSFIIMILLFFILHYFGKLYFEDQISLGYIASLTGALLMMQTVFLNFLDFLKNFGKEFAEVQNMWNFFDTTPQIQGYETGNTFQHQKGDIQLKDISYGYDTNKPVFQDFSLKIPGEQVTAFVGPSGGGKSTLVKLIAGYICPDRGEVIVDTQKLSETSLKSYYADIGYLTQEPSVFDGTVRENLLYGVSSPHLTSPKGRGIKGENLEEKMQLLSPLGREDSGVRAGEEQEKHFNKHLKKIITLANCEFIYDLPQGLDTEIGERGVKLSGGQKQRLAIAKIFLKNPKIIILDEPTSALDSLSEKKITEAMHNLFKDRTVLVIAHRLQTVKQADDIVVIQDGKVIERGTHTQLVKNKGFYKQMLDLQSGF